MDELPKLRLEIKELKQQIEEEDLQIDLEKVFVNSVLHEKQNQRVEAYRKVHNIPHKDIKLEDPCEGELLLLCAQKHPKLPTACPDSLAMLSYLVLAGVDFALIHDSHALPDLVPYVQYGPFIAFHGDKGGALQTLIEEKIIDLDNGLEESSSINLKICTEIVRGELANALTKELKNMGLVDKKRSASAMQKVYDDILSTAYKVLSTMLHDQTFFFGDRPTSLDALFLGHALFVLYVLPVRSVLLAKLNEYPNLVNYTVNHGQEVLNVEPRLMSEISSSRSRPSKLFKNYQLRYFTNLDKKELIGCGAFGNVYRGCMWGFKNPIINSKLIAVKASHHNLGDIFKQWQAEIWFGSSLQHKNFIEILGHYKDEEKLYLVYEYMKRGHLGRCYEVLHWAEMIKIARGIALAVEYMHKLDPPLTNRDLKLNNILLDEDLNPKVGDFGGVTVDGVIDDRVGTSGFVDKAVKKNRSATIKTDMHNVGVILLLLITKQPYMKNQILIGDRAMKQFKEGKEGGIVVHETLKETGCNEERATLIIKTALQCLDFPDARPSIGQVVQILHDL